MQQTSSVQPLSCDEAFMDVTGLGDPDEIASKLRAQIKAETGCTASAGIGPNMLLARLATKRAKPLPGLQKEPLSLCHMQALIFTESCIFLLLIRGWFQNQPCMLCIYQSSTMHLGESAKPSISNL